MAKFNLIKSICRFALNKSKFHPSLDDDSLDDNLMPGYDNPWGTAPVSISCEKDAPHRSLTASPVMMQPEQVCPQNSPERSPLRRFPSTSFVREEWFELACQGLGLPLPPDEVGRLNKKQFPDVAKPSPARRHSQVVYPSCQDRSLPRKPCMKRRSVSTLVLCPDEDFQPDRTVCHHLRQRVNSTPHSALPPIPAPHTQLSYNSQPSRPQSYRPLPVPPRNSTDGGGGGAQRLANVSGSRSRSWNT